MSNIPLGWEVGRLGDFITLQRGFDITKSQAREGNIPVVSSSGISYYHDVPKVNPPGVVTGRKGSLGSVFFLDSPFWPHDTTLWVRDFHGNSPEFVKVFLENQKLDRMDAATSVPTLNRNNVHKRKVVFPPLPEQRKIAEILSTWDEAIALTEQLIAALEERKKGLMQRLLTGEVRFPGFEDHKARLETKYGQIPRDWSVKTVFELGGESHDTVQTGPFGAQLHASDYVEEGTPLILIRNIDGNRLDAKDIPKISDEDALRLNKYSLKENDIVFSRVGRVGSCFIASKENEGWIISGQTLRIRLPDNVVETDYLAYALEGSVVKRYLTAISIGSTRKSISSEVLEKLPIILPSRKEQKMIAMVLRLCEDEIDLFKQRANFLIEQKKGLMQRLLTGEVRVKV
jgi:type I restriction enzyme S subunit